MDTYLKFIDIAKKWQKIVAANRKRASFVRISGNRSLSFRRISSLTDKGHFVVYSIDEKRFAIPLAYLNTTVFRELFKMSEEVFGLPSEGPIILPCQAVMVEYVVSLIQRGLDKDVENYVLISMKHCCSSISCYQDHVNHRLIVSDC